MSKNLTSKSTPEIEDLPTCSFCSKKHPINYCAERAKSDKLKKRNEVCSGMVGVIGWNQFDCPTCGSPVPKFSGIHNTVSCPSWLLGGDCAFYSRNKGSRIGGQKGGSKSSDLLKGTRKAKEFDRNLCLKEFPGDGICAKYEHGCLTKNGEFIPQCVNGDGYTPQDRKVNGVKAIDARSPSSVASSSVRGPRIGAS